MTGPDSKKTLRIFIVTGEHSGDALGGKLMQALKARLDGHVIFDGIGGHAMEAEGLTSHFPLSEIAVMGPVAILRRLPQILGRVYDTVRAGVAFEPDAIIIIDAPEFTHPVGKRIGRHLRGVPVIDYVSPSVWAWRPGRAKKMRRYIDHVLALLPFEPDAHARLGGPPCTYVGHPLVERLSEFQRAAETSWTLAERLSLDPQRPVLAVLPGSRRSEVEHLTDVFGDAVGVLASRGIKAEVIIPAVPSVRGLIESKISSWPVKPHLVEGEADKLKAFKLARAALAASGTVTLELALAGTPMVVAYKVDALAAQIRYLLKVPSVVLANLVLGANAFPEFLQEACTEKTLADALQPLLAEGNSPQRAAQLAALAKIPEKLALPAGIPSEAAADTVLRVLRESGVRFSA